MMKRLKVWWAKKADYERRRLFWVGSSLLGMTAFWFVANMPYKGMSGRLQFSKEELPLLLGEDWISLLIFAGIFLLICLAMWLPSYVNSTAKLDKKLFKFRSKTRQNGPSFDWFL